MRAAKKEREVDTKKIRGELSRTQKLKGKRMSCMGWRGQGQQYQVVQREKER